jgi:hypothetical protein
MGSECSPEIHRRQKHRADTPSSFQADQVIDTYCQKNQDTTVCQLYQALKDGNLGAFLAELDDPIAAVFRVLGELVREGINLERLERFLSTFVANIDIPEIDIPITRTFELVGETGVGIFSRTYGYAILAGFLCLLLLVWALVIYGTLHWTAGLILTVVFFLIYYFVTIIYSNDLPNYVDRQVEVILEPYQRLVSTLSLLALQAPGALVSALSAYLNQN